MTDPHEAKYKEMQKYVPFIQKVIEKLKANNDHQTDNPRKAQLQKMEMLHDLLTNKHKKIKIETLMKCEGVLIKLKAKIEKNDDSILSDIIMKPQTSGKSSSADNKDREEDFGPASPPPEVLPVDDVDQPVVIPTERRSSPVLMKASERNPTNKLKPHETLDKIKHHQYQHGSKSEDFENIRKKIFDIDCKHDSSNAPITKNQEKNLSSHQNHHPTSIKSTSHDYNHGKDSKHNKKFNQSHHLSKELNSPANKSVTPEQKLQTVKVLITEPLPANFKKQHFPPTSKFLQRSSVCHNNLRTLPQASQTKNDTNEAYNPEESWGQYNESDTKNLNEKNTSAATVFSRLGAKVSEDSPKSSKTPARYTPIPDVLKSPPLSVSDINNLLLESGSEKTLNDISEIGTRRPPKTEAQQNASPNNSFEFIRKKLAQTVKINSPKREKEDIVSPLPNERIALKYNPHPRQERLQSVSSTDGSECSTQSKINDPRVKLTISSLQHSPSQITACNVNVLPAINLSDPRLKRQSTPLLTSSPEGRSISSLSPSFTPISNIGFPSQNAMIYGRRHDPRISNFPNNSSSSSSTVIPVRRMSTNQPLYSSEENWDTDEEDKVRSPIKSNFRLSHFDQHKNDSKSERACSTESTHRGNSNIALVDREILNQSHLQKKSFEKNASTNMPCNQFNANLKHTTQKDQDYYKKVMDTNLKTKLTSGTTFLVPNAPKSDSEEDWDAEPEIKLVKPKPLLTEVSLSPMNSSPIIPGISTLHSEISPQSFISPRPVSATTAPPVHLAHMPHLPIIPLIPHVPHINHIPHVQPQYPPVGSNIHHSYRTQHSQPNNRFNSILNDTSERIKYLEAKKQKSAEPRTYKEFREAKERALAQEAAIKRAAEEAEAKKRAKEIKELHKDTANATQSANEQKVKQIDTSKKTESNKKEKKSHKEINKPLAGESSLDKMYRTQNFNASLPKTNTSFKIPKKRTDENVKEVEKKAVEVVTAAKQNKPSKNNAEDKIQTDASPSSIKIQKHENKKLSNDTKTNSTEVLENSKQHEKILDKNLSIEKDTPQTSNSIAIQLPKPIINKIKVEKLSANKQIEKEKSGNQTAYKEKHDVNLPKTDLAQEDNQITLRDPRFKSNTTSTTLTTEDVKQDLEKKSKTFGDMMITSSADKLELKPQQNLEIFNKLTQELPSLPQRILRRRNTMVVFDSAPLVDKEKLRKANALLFEDVQEEEKRKRKEAEEEKLIARRNKNLEEMFKKTDDNCTVSTQNIIAGKRRTRATINFNETANAINVFKHKTVKDTHPTNATSITPTTPSGKSRSNFKIKLKNLGIADSKKNDESDDDEPLVRVAKKEAKKKCLKTIKEPQVEDEEKDLKMDESETEAKTYTKKHTPINRNTTHFRENKEANFKPIQNEENQNCAVSSTSIDNDNIEPTTCSSTSTNRSFKKETDDNEPTSTASKSNNPTPTPEPNEPVLQEIVDQILKPNSNREPILAILAQILSEEKLALIKSLIENSNTQTDEQATKEINTTTYIGKSKTAENENEQEQEERKAIVTHKTVAGKKITTIPKKKRSELDRLNEDIRDMFICNGVLTATGRRMCTMMGKDIATTSSKETKKESTPIPTCKQENDSKNKSDILKPPTVARNLRRSTRTCKTTDDNDDNESLLSRSTEDSIDDSNSIMDSSGTDTTPIRKMPVLKPHTPIKIIDEINPKPKESGIKRKADSKCGGKTKKAKTNKEDAKSNSDTDENDYEAELDETENKSEELKTNKKDIKNTNLHWHNQSKHTTWCLICDKRISVYTSSLHYKTHHRENYLSRMAPVLLQQYKQEKLSQPLFGVKKGQKQPSWFYRCPFCLKYFNTALPLWLEHFQNHTVEFRYECSKCFRSNNRKLNIIRHIKNCEMGATVLNSPVKLNVSNVINAHVCHLCNFIQLKRENLERHYIEQHQLKKKTVDLLGYTIKLFDVDGVECVSEEKAKEKEKEAWKSIEENEQIIDIDDDNDNDDDGSSNFNTITTKKDVLVQEVTGTSSIEENQKEIGDEIKSNTNFNNLNEEMLVAIANQVDTEDPIDTNKIQSTKLTHQEETNQNTTEQENINKVIDKNLQEQNISQDLEDSQTNDQEVTNQLIQDELLALAAKAAEMEGEDKEEEKQISQLLPPDNQETHVSFSNNSEKINKTTMETTLRNQEANLASIVSGSKAKSTISDISSSTNSVCNRNDENSNPKNMYQAASNIFMPTRDENNYSPTIQILAQSIINIDQQDNQSIKEKPITIAERLSQRFKDLQADNASAEKPTTSSKSTSSENAFEKLIDDTLLELSKEKEYVNKNSADQISAAACTAPVIEKSRENVFDKLFSDTVLELERDEMHSSNNELIEQQVTADIPKENPLGGSITVISDDEDWEDIEITETAPTISTMAAGNNQKSKSKGLFQKFGIFKGNANKSKKHLSPMSFLPKKKTKEKSSPATTIPFSPTTTTTTEVTVSANKTNEINNTNTSNSNGANSGFKPVINIMDGLFPDSPCNDPIDLVPELAPLEPLQDLNDISSILDSNLSAVNINAADNHTSIEDALDFVSEQQANDKEKSNPLSFAITQSQAKTTINNISHVGFSSQIAGENVFKFYCLLQNCPFLYSSDSIGLETHFMCEHSQIKWNGYCLMCQSQCFPNNSDASGEYPISEEIRHMMETHANKHVLNLNSDSTQNSNSSNHDNDERPKIKLRRLTGDCLSRATPENVIPNSEVMSSEVIKNMTTPLTMLGALLAADPKPPTKDMPPQFHIPLTEPLLVDNNNSVPSFRNANSDFLITSVTSAAPNTNQTSLQISNVVSLNKNNIPEVAVSEQMQIPKIVNVITLASRDGTLWTQHIENESSELREAAAESLEVTRILENAPNTSKNREIFRTANDSPVLIAETLPIAQSTTGDFVVTQTLSAQYDKFSSTAVGFNISIAPSTIGDNTNPVASRQYKCMGSGCKFVSRVPVAMSDHLRFHERRNFSNKHDYLACGFCSYCASDIDDYMKHANHFHIINKTVSASSESDTATSLTKKIHNILNSKKGSAGQIKYSSQNQSSNQTKQVADTKEVYLSKLKNTIEEIVAPTGLADDKLYRCVIKNCHSQLTDGTFLSHVMYHITTTGGNPNNYVFKCPHCTAQYQRATGIKAHIKNHARNRYFCFLCEQTTTNAGQMLKHFSDNHWHTKNMHTKELLTLNTPVDPAGSAIDSNYYVAYSQDLTAEEVRKFGEKLILDWQREKTGSKTHFKSSEIDLLPLMAIFQRQVNCGECEYKTKVRTNMYRHLLMHKQNPGLAHEIGQSSVVDPVNPVPCLNSNERFFDKMTNLASSSLTTTALANTLLAPKPYKFQQAYVDESKRFVCGCLDCNYHTISYDLLRSHLTTVHNSELIYTCPFCKDDVCKRGISIDRIMNHIRFHGNILYRCEECDYFHHLRYVVERHINEKHSALKINLVTHLRSSEDSVTGTMSSAPFAGKNYNPFESRHGKLPAPDTRATTSNETPAPKTIVTHIIPNKGRVKWECDGCGYKAGSVYQIQAHCQQQHSVKNQYKCVHCNFGSQQLAQILHHVDEKHSGKPREAQTMYHKLYGNGEEVADTRPLWQRNDPKRVRHIRGILMEDEEESEEYQKKLALTEDVDTESNEDHVDEVEENEKSSTINYLVGYEFGCYYCSFKSQKFADLKDIHYNQNHNCQLETAKPFWYRLYRRLCCPECCSFIGNYNELQKHLQNKHKKCFYAADIKMAENEDTTNRIVCGYCPFHCSTPDQLYRHYIKAQHWPQDIRIDNNEQIMEMLAIGKSQVSYQCTLCADIFPNRVAIVQHACNSHAGEESFSLRELSNSLIYRCSCCCYTNTVEAELLKHSINHYSRFKTCCFCSQDQSSFNGYMQHCFANHTTRIEKFRTLFPIEDIKKFLLQTLVIFPSGLVLNKRNLCNTKYGKEFAIYNLYEEIYKISQEPPIPRLSIARLVARKSIEAQQKTRDNSSSSALQDDILNSIQSLPKPISKRRCTVAFDNNTGNTLLNPSINTNEEKLKSTLPKRRTTIDLDQQVQQVYKRRRTVAVDHETLFSTNLTSSRNNLLTELGNGGKKRKSSITHMHVQKLPSNLDMEPFSFYGQKSEVFDLSKIYTKVAIGGIKTPLTIDKFKLLFNIDCQLKLTKCDEDSQLLAYNDYKHIKKPCPASEKLRYD